MLTLQAPWHAPDAVSQFITQAVKAWVWGMIEGRPGGGGTGVTVCCASAGVQPRPRINTPMASLEFTRTPLSPEGLPYSTLVEVWRARRPMREIVIDTETTGLGPLKR